MDWRRYLQKDLSAGSEMAQTVPTASVSSGLIGARHEALIVTPPARLRQTLDGLSVSALSTRCRIFRIHRLGDPLLAAKYALRFRDCRYHQSSEEIRNLKYRMRATQLTE